MKKSFWIEVYQDDKERPICAKHFPDKVCRFLQLQRFGTIETCFFSETDWQGYNVSLERYDSEIGYLKPHENCPIWNKGE